MISKTNRDGCALETICYASKKPLSNAELVYIIKMDALLKGKVLSKEDLSHQIRNIRARLINNSDDKILALMKTKN
jgi:hypothetical protein